MALNTAAQITAYFCTIFEDAMFIAREAAVMPALVTSFNNSTNENVGRSASAYNSATIADIGETDDLQSQSFTPAVLSTLTPAEKGAQYFITDPRLSADPFGVRNDASLELGAATSTKINSDLLGDMGSFTGGTIGAAGTVITWGHFFAGVSQLVNTKAPRPWFAVLHPFQWHVLAKAVAPGATVTNAPMFQDEVTKQWFVGSVAGVDIFVTSDLTIDGSGDAKGGIFARSALAFDGRRAPRLEPERDASRRGWELNMTTVYAHGVWRPAFGITMYFDAATPTA